MNDELNIRMEVTDDQIIFHIENGDPASVGFIAAFLSEGMNRLEEMLTAEESNTDGLPN